MFAVAPADNEAPTINEIHSMHARREDAEARAEQHRNVGSEVVVIEWGANGPSVSDRQAIVAREYRAALDNITPNMGTRYSGQQVAAAKGIARKRALKIIDGTR